MNYLIEVLATFRIRGVLHQPGRYRIPEDLSPEVAQAQLKAENATKLGHVKSGAPENKATEAPEHKGPLSRESGPDKPSPSSPAAPAQTLTTHRLRGRPPKS
jgi:hypothetical protein